MRWLIARAKTNRANVAVNIPRNLRTVFEGILPLGIINALMTKGKVLFEGVELVRVTRLKPIFDAGASPMVVFHPSKDLLKTVDSTNNVSEVLVVPITFEEIKAWVEKWKATKIDL